MRPTLGVKCMCGPVEGTNRGAYFNQVWEEEKRSFVAALDVFSLMEGEKVLDGWCFFLWMDGMGLKVWREDVYEMASNPSVCLPTVLVILLKIGYPVVGLLLTVAFLIHFLLFVFLEGRSEENKQKNQDESSPAFPLDRSLCRRAAQSGSGLPI